MATSKSESSFFYLFVIHFECLILLYNVQLEKPRKTFEETVTPKFERKNQMLQLQMNSHISLNSMLVV